MILIPKTPPRKLSLRHSSGYPDRGGLLHCLSVYWLFGTRVTLPNEMVRKRCSRQNLEVAGAPLSITRTFSGAELVFDSAIPVRGVSGASSPAGSPVKLGYTYEGRVIRVKHVGSYQTLTATHRKISAYLAALGIDRNGDAWESYVSDPTRVAEADLLTYVYYPIRERP